MNGRKGKTRQGAEESLANTIKNDICRGRNKVTTSTLSPWKHKRCP